MASPLTSMADELYRAAVKGDITVLSEENIAKHGEAYYKDQTTPRKNNIIHIAVEHGRTEFIKVALDRFPELTFSTNGNMDTPLHVASRKGYDEIVKLVLSLKGSDAIIIQNLQGDTALHLALSNNKLRAAMDLLGVCSPAVLSLVNACQETPLHIFLKCCIGTHTTIDTLLEEGVLNLQGVYKSNFHMNTQRFLSSSMLVEGVLTKLLEYKPATYMPDAEGLTPLLIAAQRGSFLALWEILERCPQSAEACDLQGKTVLHHLNSHIIIPSQKNLHVRDYDHDHNQQHEHPKTAPRFQSICYWELKKLLSVPEITAIKDTKDSHGNTPSYVALANEDFLLVKMLFECFADFTIKNKNGASTLDLIKSFPDFANKMEEVVVKEKVLSQPMDEKLFKAAKEGDLTLLSGIETDIESGKVTYSDKDYDFFLGRTNQGLSILHIAVKNGQKAFVQEAIKHFPTLVLTADSSGETPLHVGARLKDLYTIAATLLQHTRDCVNKFRDEAGPSFLEALPWRQKNSKGDTPLHEALRSSSYDIAIELIKIDSELSAFENNAGETPLHILARYSIYTSKSQLFRLF